MTSGISYRNLSFALSGTSLTLAVINVVLGRWVNYLEHLMLFNVMAMGMLGLAVIALVAGVIGTRIVRGREASLWIANGLATVLITVFLSDP